MKMIFNDWLTDNKGRRVGKITIQSKRRLDKIGRNALARRICATYKRWCEDYGYDPTPEISEFEIKTIEKRIELMKENLEIYKKRDESLFRFCQKV